MPTRLLLADPDSLLRWAHHTVAPRRTRDGLAVNALHGLCSLLLRTLERERPGRALACWDAPAPTWRHARHPGYQAGREPEPPELAPQRQLAREFIAALDWPQCQLPELAARDLLAALSADSADEVRLLSSDRDLCQLVSPVVTLLCPRGGDWDCFDPAAVATRYGVPPERWAEAKALCGDPGNGLAGVPKIGEKTAAQLLAEHGDLAGVLAAPVAGVRGARLRESAAVVQANLAVIQLRRDAAPTPPPGGWPRPVPQAERLASLLRDWDFHDLTRRLSPRLLAPPGDLAYRWARDEATAARVLAAAQAARLIGLAGSPKGVAVSPARADAWLLPPAQAEPLVAALARGGESGLGFVAHDLTRLEPFLARARPAAVGDTWLAQWLLEPDRPVPGVVEAGRHWLGLTEETPADLAREAARLCLEADWVRRLEPALRAELEAAGLGPVYREHELPLARSLGRMAAAGVRLAGRREPLVLRRLGAAGRIGVARPAAADLPDCVEPEPGCVLWEVQYVDPAIWLVAGLSGDRGLLAALAQPVRAAVAVAAELWGRTPEAVTAEQRERAAALNTAAARGGDLAWLQRRLGLPAAEARGLQAAWEARFPAVPQWRRDLAARARRSGWLRTLGGRRLRVDTPDPAALSGRVLEAALADLLGRALLALEGLLAREGRRGARVVLPLARGWLLELAADEPGPEPSCSPSLGRLADLDMAQPVAVTARPS